MLKIGDTVVYKHSKNKNYMNEWYKPGKFKIKDITSCRCTIKECPGEIDIGFSLQCYGYCEEDFELFCLKKDDKWDKLIKRMKNEG